MGGGSYIPMRQQLLPILLNDPQTFLRLLFLGFQGFLRLVSGLGLGLGLGLEEIFVFDSKSENRDRAVESVESVSEARAV